MHLPLNKYTTLPTFTFYFTSMVLFFPWVRNIRLDFEEDP